MILLFCGSCKKQIPQLPANKGANNENQAGSFQKINRNLIQKEDSILKNLAGQKHNFKRNELGFWYKIISSGKGETIKDSSVCNYHYHLFNTKGKLLKFGENQIIIGKKQTIKGLEEGLKLMQKGDSASFIIPWYLAYGLAGEKGLIPPFSSVIFDVKIPE